MTTYPSTNLNRVVRKPERGNYDKATIYPIIDEALVCHVAFVQDGHPFVIPTLHARDGDSILLHGSSTSRLIEHAGAGNELCIGITLVDGIVLARTVFNHSINYRSVVLFGSGSAIEGRAEKMAVLAAFTERLLPGRWDDARLPTEQELKATGAVRVPINLASAKVRTGPPKDDAEDLGLPIWAGVLPLRIAYGDLQADPKLSGGIAIPDYLQEYLRHR